MLVRRAPPQPGRCRNLSRRRAGPDRLRDLHDQDRLRGRIVDALPKGATGKILKREIVLPPN
ncbi:hypothetical protein GCM10010448_10820 [Streptomyces glomeratus]|uniref:AMP-binding enzyme C-terminal domain-containing protein n=1 Tax=Streptomyces glomeratus TaxID=284452 RepID=A0ABP6L5K5_9ACTN